MFHDQAVGEERVFISTNDGASFEWPILEKADGRVMVNIPIMHPGFLYDGRLAGEDVVFVADGAGGVAIYEGKVI